MSITRMLLALVEACQVIAHVPGPLRVGRPTPLTIIKTTPPSTRKDGGDWTRAYTL